MRDISPSVNRELIGWMFHVPSGFIRSETLMLLLSMFSRFIPLGLPPPTLFTGMFLKIKDKRVWLYFCYDNLTKMCAYCGLLDQQASDPAPDPDPNPNPETQQASLTPLNLNPQTPFHEGDLLESSSEGLGLPIQASPPMNLATPSGKRYRTPTASSSMKSKKKKITKLHQMYDL
uniref:Uncharacterized protein n=1 Tax=Nelumbo nucifera TaxID=4432 RepID=A0A822Z1P6_NELNU|nr:TPA_asm: hypothetical protein HUJ06_013244 [Nelumbo nucifera]